MSWSRWRATVFPTINLYIPTSSVPLGASVGREVRAPADHDNLVTFRSLALQIDSLVFATRCVWTSHSKHLESCFRRKILWDSPRPSISALFACFWDSSATSVIFFALKVGPSQPVPIQRMSPEILSWASVLPHLKAPLTPNDWPLDFPFGVQSRSGARIWK